MPKLVVREDGSVKESLSSTTIKKIVSASVSVLVFLVTYLRNKIAEFQSLYALEDIRMPSRESARPDKDKSPRTRGNPIIMVGDAFVWGVKPKYLDDSVKREWLLHLSDGKSLTLRWQDYLHHEHLCKEIFDRRVDLLCSLGYSVEKDKDGILRPVFGGYLTGFSTGFKKLIVIEYEGKEMKVPAIKAYQLYSELLDKHNEGNGPVPSDPATDAFLGRLASREQQRTYRDTGMDEDNSEDVYGDGVVSRWEFYPPSQLPGDESTRHSGAQFGKGMVHPAFTVRLGNILGVYKMVDNKDGTVKFDRVRRTIPLQLRSGDTILVDKFIERSNYGALMNSIRRELKEGNTPFIVQSYDGKGKYPKNQRIYQGDNEDGQPVFCDTPILLPARRGEKLKINWSCTRRKNALSKKDDEAKTCGNKEYYTHTHGIECTVCGGQLWRNKVTVFVPLFVKGISITDGPGRYITIDPEAGGTHIAITMFGSEVGNLVNNMVRENYDPSQIRYTIKLSDVEQTYKDNKIVSSDPVYRKVFTGIQRFWFQGTNRPMKPGNLVPKIYQPGLKEFNVEPSAKYDPKAWKKSLPIKYRKAHDKLGIPELGEGGSDSGWCSDPKPKKRKLPKHIKVKPTLQVVSEYIKWLKRKKRKAMEDAENAIHRIGVDADEMIQLEADEASGAIKVDRNPDGSINLD